MEASPMKYVVYRRDYDLKNVRYKVAEFDTQKEAEDYCVARNHHLGSLSMIKECYHMWEKEEGEEEE
jgi:hypothetical protein